MSNKFNKQASKNYLVTIARRNWLGTGLHQLNEIGKKNITISLTEPVNVIWNLVEPSYMEWKQKTHWKKLNVKSK